MMDDVRLMVTTMGNLVSNAGFQWGDVGPEPLKCNDYSVQYLSHYDASGSSRTQYYIIRRDNRVVCAVIYVYTIDCIVPAERRLDIINEEEYLALLLSL